MRYPIVVRRDAPVLALALGFLPGGWGLPIDRDVFGSAYRPEARAGLSSEERATAQRSIEEVYWRHRIWPEENPGPKPPLSAVMPDEAVRAKVEDSLRKSNALETYWQRPITGAQLQAEMDRMASQTRDPEVLRELFAALADDPFVIAETLARPLLADRLIRRWYARDPRFHGELGRRAEQALAGSRTIEDLTGSGGRFREVRWTRPSDRGSEGDSEDAPEETALPESTPRAVHLDAEGWERLQGTLRGWAAASADRARIDLTFEGRPVEQLGPIEETDDEYSVTVVTGAGEDHVSAAVVSWAKTPFDTWWRQESPSTSPNLALPATDYVLAMPRELACADDSWSMIGPTATWGHTAVWTGSEMIIFGYPSWRYDPSTDMWRPASVGAGAPSPRSGHTAIWTGTEMIVWGGQSGSTYLNTGGRYSPSSDSWIATDAGAGVPSARTGHTAVWTGTEMIIWGGLDAGGYLRTGGRYKPDTPGHWVATSTGGNVPNPRSSHTAIWTGSEMIVWGGTNGSLFFNSGERYNPSTNAWTDVGQAGGIPSARSSHTAVWTGRDMIIWGGYNGGYLNTGSAYNPETNLWRTAAVGAGSPAGRSLHTAVWTGTRMIVWGGSNATTRFNDGGVYDAGANAWSPVGSSPAPLTARDLHTAIWTGSEMIVWGGRRDQYSQQAENTGARYSPISDSWVSMRPDDPTARYLNTAVWTGSEMIIWGGESDVVTRIPFDTGNLYDPSTNNWRRTSVEAETPSPRFNHAAVWTGTKMVVWGGCVNNYFYPTDTGGLYDPMADLWSQTSTTGAPSARSESRAIWTGASMLVWGGRIDTGDFVNTGGRYDPSADSWTPTAVEGAPQGRYQHTMVWTGSRAIVWGGRGLNGTFMPLDTGGQYDPCTDSWSPTSTGPGHPSARTSHTAIWTGNEMIVWGGASTVEWYNTGFRYDPSTDRWTPTNSGVNVPSPRNSHTAIWTAAEMIIWGGQGAAGYLGTGGRYNPAADFWQPTSTVGSPFWRSYHTAVAAGSEMIVWGGRNSSAWPFADGGAYCYACASSTWYRDSDGDGFGDPSASAASCVQPPGYVANSGDCNDASAACHPGGTEICDGLDNDCDGTTDDAMPPTSPPVLQVDNPDRDTARLSWGAVGAADAYDVVRGSLDLLLSTGGDFTVATGACLGNDLAGTTYEDSTVPGGGQGFWYLVRAVNCGGPASYDEGAASQVGSRDAEIQASAAACP